MLKKLQKTLFSLIMIIALMSSVCFATEEATDGANVEVTSTSNADGAEVTAETATETEDSENADPATDSSTSDPDMVLNDLFLVDETINYSTIVDGNAYVIGNDITISSIIGGDLFILGNNVTLTKDCVIYGNLFIAANEANLDCYVYGGNLYAACATITIGEDGAVYRDMYTMSSKLDFRGAVGRNVYSTADQIELGENTKIYGDFNYSSGNAIEVPSDAVNGKINYKELEESEEETVETNPVVSYLSDLASHLVYTVIVFFLILLFAPKFISKLESVGTDKIGPSLLKGLLVLLVTPIVAIALMITVVGIPVSLALLVLWGLLVFALSSTIAIISIAGIVAKKVEMFAKVHNLPAVVIVALVTWILGLVPFVGAIINLLLCIYGLGLLFQDVFMKKNKEEVKPVQE